MFRRKNETNQKNGKGVSPIVANDFPEDELDLSRLKIQSDGAVGGSLALSQLVPEEYIIDPYNAEPTFDNLLLFLFQKQHLQNLQAIYFIKQLKENF